MLKQLGKYTIMEQIGKGSMGQVYKAKDQNIGRIAAIKTIKLPDSSDAEKKALVKRFKQEAMAAGNLNHPNIVVIYEYDEVDDIAYIAMEYIEGEELKSYFDNNEVFTQGRIIEIMTQLLDALEYSHQRGVVHRDIKPSNIMITPSGQVKVTDFGIARLESSELTQAGSTLGTPSYMSPEQCTGQAVDARSDLFSAGVLLYQLLTGDKPFTGPSITAILHKITQVSPPPPSKLNFGISPGFDPIIEQCLAKRPEDRFASAAELSRALSALADTGRATGGQQRITKPEDDEATAFLEPLQETQVSLAAQSPQGDATIAVPLDDGTIAVPLGDNADTSLRDQLLNDATVVASVESHEKAPAHPAPKEHERKQADGEQDGASAVSAGWRNRYTYIGAAALVTIAVLLVFTMKGNISSPPQGKDQEMPEAAQSVRPPEAPPPEKTENVSGEQHTAAVLVQAQEPEKTIDKEEQGIQETAVNEESETGVEEQKEPDSPHLIDYMIVSEPPGASVELEPGGVLGSVTPLEIRLPSGAHQLYITKAGYHDMSLIVDVQESGNSQLRLKLRPM